MRTFWVLRYSALLVTLAGSAQQPASQPPKEPTNRTKVVLLGTGQPAPDPERSGPATAIVVDDSAYTATARVLWSSSRRSVVDTNSDSPVMARPVARLAIAPTV